MLFVGFCIFNLDDEKSSDFRILIKNYIRFHNCFERLFWLGASKNVLKSKHLGFLHCIKENLIYCLSKTLIFFC